MKLTDLTINGMYQILKAYDEYVRSFPDYHDEGSHPVTLMEFLEHEYNKMLEFADDYIIIDTTGYPIIVTNEVGIPIIFRTLEEAMEYGEENIQFFQVIPLKY